MEEKDGLNNQESHFASNLQQLTPVVTEKRLWNLNYVFLSVFLGFAGIAIEYVAVSYYNLDTLRAVILGAIIVVVYAVVLFFLLEPEMLREVKMTAVRTVDRPVTKEVYIDKPAIVKEVIRNVDKPIYIDRPVVKKIFVPTPRKKLDIPVYDYLGSSETKTYHKRGCRFSKLIKKKYKVSNNSAGFFKSRNYKPCQICILKTKKV